MSFSTTWNRSSSFSVIRPACHFHDTDISWHISQKPGQDVGNWESALPRLSSAFARPLRWISFDNDDAGDNYIDSNNDDNLYLQSHHVGQASTLIWRWYCSTRWQRFLTCNQLKIYFMFLGILYSNMYFMQGFNWSYLASRTNCLLNSFGRPSP